MLSERVRPGRSGLRAALIAAGIGVFASTGASAGTLVTNWNFTLDNAWTSTTPGEGAVTYSNDNSHFGAPSLISWGDPFTPNTLQSSLEVGESNGHFAGSLVTGGPFVDTVDITHNNWPQTSPTIGGSPWLTAATLSDLLTLHPTLPNPPFDGTQTHQPPQLNFEIKFLETENGPNDEMGEMGTSCADINSPDGGGCNDIFVLMLPTEAVFSGGLLRQQFTFDDFDYEAQIALTGLGPLSDAECIAAGGSTNVDGGTDDGLADNCIGLTTPENMASVFEASLRIVAIEREVSEPGTLALLGLGLLGLGYVRRRRHA